MYPNYSYGYQQPQQGYNMYPNGQYQNQPQNMAYYQQLGIQQSGLNYQPNQYGQPPQQHGYQLQQQMPQQPQQGYQPMPQQPQHGYQQIPQQGYQQIPQQGYQQIHHMPQQPNVYQPQQGYQQPQMPQSGIIYTDRPMTGESGGMIRGIGDPQPSLYGDGNVQENGGYGTSGTYDFSEPQPTLYGDGRQMLDKPPSQQSVRVEHPPKTDSHEIISKVRNRPYQHAVNVEHPPRTDYEDKSGTHVRKLSVSQFFDVSDIPPEVQSKITTSQNPQKTLRDSHHNVDGAPQFKLPDLSQIESHKRTDIQVKKTNQLPNDQAPSKVEHLPPKSTTKTVQNPPRDTHQNISVAPQFKLPDPISRHTPDTPHNNAPPRPDAPPPKLYNDIHSTKEIQNSVALNEDFRPLPEDIKSEISKFRIEGYAKDYFNTHKTKSLFFKRNVPVEKLLKFYEGNLNQSLTNQNPENSEKAISYFTKLTKYITSDIRHPDLEPIREIIIECIKIAPLRDELYCQILKQTNDNPNIIQIVKGFEIFSMVLEIFAPTRGFENYLKEYLTRYYNESGKVGKCARYCFKRLDFLTKNDIGTPKRPNTIDLEMARDAPYKNSVFRNSLEKIMDIQQDKFSHLNIPKVVEYLTEIVESGVEETGLFRIQASYDEISRTRFAIESGDYEYNPNDPHVAACLLKVWLKEIYSPVIPLELYYSFIKSCSDVDTLRKLIDTLPDTNRETLIFLIHFLRRVASVETNLMTPSNLALVISPNLCRCPDNDSPQSMMMNSESESTMLNNLIVNY